MRIPAAARQQWARRCCPSQDHRARTPLLVVAASAPQQFVSKLCFATTEWPLRGQQALRQPRNCTAVGLQCLAWARGAEAAHEACASLCMSQWIARGGQKTSTSTPSRKTRDSAFLQQLDFCAATAQRGPPDALRGRLRGRRYTISRWEQQSRSELAEQTLQNSFTQTRRFSA